MILNIRRSNSHSLTHNHCLKPKKGSKNKKQSMKNSKSKERNSTSKDKKKKRMTTPFDKTKKKINKNGSDQILLKKNQNYVHVKKDRFQSLGDWQQNHRSPSKHHRWNTEPNPEQCETIDLNQALKCKKKSPKKTLTPTRKSTSRKDQNLNKIYEKVKNVLSNYHGKLEKKEEECRRLSHENLFLRKMISQYYH